MNPVTKKLNMYRALPFTEGSAANPPAQNSKPSAKTLTAGRRRRRRTLVVCRRRSGTPGRRRRRAGTRGRRAGAATVGRRRRRRRPGARCGTPGRRRWGTTRAPGRRRRRRVLRACIVEKKAGGVQSGSKANLSTKSVEPSGIFMSHCLGYVRNTLLGEFSSFE